MRKANSVTSEKDNSVCRPIDATIFRLITNIREKMSEPERMAFMYALDETLKTRDNCVYVRADHLCRFKEKTLLAFYQSIIELPLRTAYEYGNTKKCISESGTLISSVSYSKKENVVRIKFCDDIFYLLLLLLDSLDSPCNAER
ncbi:MAG: hypothetical protein ACI4FX_03130 [Agathobacter sp.]